MTNSGPLKVYMFSHPRTVSNVFVRVFGNHPGVKIIAYPFMLPSVFGPDKPPGPNLAKDLSADALEKLLTRYKDQSFESVRTLVRQKIDAATAEGKVPFVKDHAFYITRLDVVMFEMMKGISGAQAQAPRHDPGHTNPLIYTDEFMDSVTPILTIRHPARMIPSFYRLISKGFSGRVTDPSWGVLTSYKWLRILFDWYIARAAECGCESKVIVIDGDEFVNDAEGIVAQFCRVTGVNPKGVQFAWEAGTSNVEAEDRPAEWEHVDSLAESSLRKSSHIEKDLKLLTDPDAASEAKKWTQEFGEEISMAIVLAVKRSMEDYEYLRKFTMKGLSA